jgi:hypothetical protein
MYKVDIRGCDGITKTVIINSPDSIPAVGEPAVVPVFVGQTGSLREARD